MPSFTITVPDIHQGPGYVWYNVAVPAAGARLLVDSSGNPTQGSPVAMGASEGAATFHMEAKIEEISIDQETAPVDAVMTAESAYLEVTLKESSLSKISKALAHTGRPRGAVLQASLKVDSRRVEKQRTLFDFSTFDFRLYFNERQQNERDKRNRQRGGFSHRRGGVQVASGASGAAQARQGCAHATAGADVVHLSRAAAAEPGDPRLSAGPRAGRSGRKLGQRGRERPRRAGAAGGLDHRPARGSAGRAARLEGPRAGRDHARDAGRGRRQLHH